MQEEEFFSGGGVSVTRTRFVTAGQTYAMSGVTSVRAVESKPSYVGAVVLGIVGAIFAMAGLSGSGGPLAIGVILLVAAVALGASKKTEYLVQLSVSSGEVQALKSHDRDFIAGVVKALNDCIIARG